MEETRLLVDWFSFSIARSDFFSNEADEQYIFDRIKAKLFLDGLNYKELRARYGYNVVQSAQGISICYGGRDDIFIDFSGSGCRAFESLHPDLPWEKWIGYLLGSYSSLHISRIDIACDTFGLLAMAKIQKWTMAEKFISRWRRWGCHVGSNENWVMFGAPTSDFRCRIYDKTQERRSKVGKEVEVPEKWVRVEFQMRNETASSFIKAWRGSGDLSVCFFGILRNQLNFYSAFDGEHYDRIVLTSWWRQLVGQYGRIPLAYAGGLEYNLEDLKMFVLKQAGSSVRTYIDLFGVEQLAADVAGSSYNDRQRVLIDRFRSDDGAKQGYGVSEASQVAGLL